MINQYFIALYHYLLVSVPYLCLGLLVSGFVHQFLPLSLIKKQMGAHKFSSVIKAALIGVPLPLCSCSVIPTAVSLKKAGAGNGATSSFLISTPESGVDSISLTYALMDLPLTIIRPVVAFITAVTAGFFNYSFNEVTENIEEDANSHCCSKKEKEDEKKSIKKALKFGFVDLLQDISLWLTFGLLLGALLEVLIPEKFFSDLGMLNSKIVILFIGIPLYICASATTPIAAALMMKGISPGTGLLFLLVGPATNLSNILILQKYIGKKGVFINVATIVICSLVAASLVDYLYDYFNWPLHFKIAETDHDHSHTWQMVLVILFVPLLLRALWKEEIQPRIKKA